MPHCILEYSDNQLDNPNITALFTDLHNELLKLWRFNKDDFKSRAIEYHDYVIGNGEKQNAFVALQLQLMSGKSDEEKKRLSEAALAVLQKYFSRTLADRVASISVQVVNVDKASYSRVQS